MAGSSSTFLLTGTAAGVLALLTLGLARAARRCGPPRTLAAFVAAGIILWIPGSSPPP